jgi:hypothetical protein
MKIENEIRNEDCDKRERKLVVPRKINCSAKSDGGKGSEVRHPGRAGSNKESRDHAVGNGEEDQK